MIDFLEDLLKAKCEMEHCSILHSKWSQDKLFLNNMLSNVSNIFPHYSDHSTNHSDMILSNIVRVIGKDRIVSFGATDLWLLLSAAYYHDIGMVLFQQRLQEIFSKEKLHDHFFDFLEGIYNDKSSPLNDKIDFIELDGDLEWNKRIKFKNKVLDENSLNSFISIFSDYIRKTHGEESRNFIDKLYGKYDCSETSITSIIPVRLFSILGQICAGHTKDFCDVMKGISFEEQGVGDGYCCHPLLIACLLRMGDLLDLDNNRINMASIAFYGIKSLPSDSRKHLLKHRSIDHLVIDNRKIDIHAKVDSDNNLVETKGDCVNYEVAEVIYEWFSWLEKELQNQKSRWKSISPEYYNISLPDIGKLEVDLGNGYEYLIGKQKPQFEINTKQAFELVQGMNVYKTPWVAIREILQNAVDTTLIKFWHDFDHTKLEGEDDINEKFKVQYDKYCQNIGRYESKSTCESKFDEGIPSDIKKYAIIIDISTTEKKEQDAVIASYKVKIRDNGMGMTKEDIKYLLSVGSGKLNPNKKKRLQAMPDWFKPSGAFGIGFQSIFMLTDAVDIKTRSQENGKCYDIKMFSPLGKHNGAVLIKENTEERIDGSFSEIVFEIDSKKYGEPELYNDFFSISNNREKNDPFMKDGETLFLSFILQQIKSFAKYSPFPIYVSSCKKGNHKDKELTCFREARYFKYNIQKFDININEEEKEKVITQVVIKEKSEKQLYSGVTNIFFKNQYVCEISKLSYPYIDIDLNILSGDAKDWLTLDRNQIRKEKKNSLDIILRKSLEMLFKDSGFIQEHEDNSRLLSHLSVIDFVFLSNKEYIKDHITENWLKNKWTSVYFTCYGTSDQKTSENLADIASRLDKICYINDKDASIDISLVNNCININVGGASDLYNLKILLNTFLLSSFQEISDNNNTRNIVYTFIDDERKSSSFDINIIGKEGKQYEIAVPELSNFSKWFRSYLGNESFHSLKRFLIPCPKGYEDLAIDTKGTESYIDFFLPFDLDSKCGNLMVSPFCYGDGMENIMNMESLIDFVYTQKRKDVSKEDIRKKYFDLVEELQNEKDVIP